MPLSRTDTGVRLHVRLTPNASANRIQGVVAGAVGPQLKVQVTNVPEDGKANTALIKLLSKTWKLPKTSFSIVSGQTDRNKILAIVGPSAEIFKMIASKIKN